MAVTFKCLTSGQTVTFEAQVDIDSMKGHNGYVQVEETQVQEELKTATKNSKKTVTPTEGE